MTVTFGGGEDTHSSRAASSLFPHPPLVPPTRYREALGDLTSALKVAPTYLAARTQRAKLLLMLGRCAEAHGEYEVVLEGEVVAAKAKASKAKPDAPPPKDTAIVDAQRGVTRAMECAQAHEGARKLADRRDWRGAHELFSKAMEYTEVAPELLLERARASLELGENYDAIADTGRTLKMSPENIAAFEARGDI